MRKEFLLDIYRRATKGESGYIKFIFQENFISFLIIINLELVAVYLNQRCADMKLTKQRKIGNNYKLKSILKNKNLKQEH